MIQHIEHLGKLIDDCAIYHARVYYTEDYPGVWSFESG